MTVRPAQRDGEYPAQEAIASSRVQITVTPTGAPAAEAFHVEAPFLFLIASTMRVRYNRFKVWWSGILDREPRLFAQRAWVDTFAGLR